MTKPYLASKLNQRILLWRRIRQETPDGDLSDHWLPLASLWANIRLHKWSTRDTQTRDDLEITIYPTSYSFQGIQWNGSCYRITSSLQKDPQNHTCLFYAKKAKRFNQI